MLSFLGNNNILSKNEVNNMQSFSESIGSVKGESDSALYVKTQNVIRDFERKVCMDNSLGSEEKEDLLKLMAIAKSSCDYWFANRDKYFKKEGKDPITAGEFALIAVADAIAFPFGWMMFVTSVAFLTAMSIS